jgi:hypothetical protein
MSFRRTQGALKVQHDSLEHRGGRLRAKALRSSSRHSCCCAKPGSFFRDNSLSFPCDAAPGVPVRRAGNRLWEETGII